MTRMSARSSWYRLLAGLSLLGLAAVTGSAAKESSIRPNIVVIYADDLGIGDVSCYNPASAWQTPRLDRMAREGVRFTDAHAASSLCTPSRYALLTGRYAWRGRLKRAVLNGYDSSLIEPDRQTIAGFLRNQGYATTAIGKWHLGLDWQRHGAGATEVDFSRSFGGGPTAHGFDRFFGLSASLDMPPYVWLRDDRATAIPVARVEDSEPPRLWRTGPIGPDFKMEEVQPRLVEEAISYFRERARVADRAPFFLYLALASPHTPVLPTAAFAGKTGVTAYGDFVTQVDADVGRLLDALAELGLDQETLVVFTSDNGFAPAADVPEHRRHGHDPSAGFRGYKSDLFEGGHRVPLIVRWPGTVPANVRQDGLVAQFDLFATCADLLGAALPADAAEDSISALPLFQGDEPHARRETIVNHSAEGRFAIREDRWKLLLWPGSGGWSSPTPSPSRWLKVEATDLDTLPPWQLYDLAADPAETRNLAEAHPEIAQRLARRLKTDIERGRSTPGPARPVEIGGDWPETAWMTMLSRE